MVSNQSDEAGFVAYMRSGSSSFCEKMITSFGHLSDELHMLRQAEGIDPNKQYTVDYDEKRHRESISLAELEEENKRIGAAVARLIQMHGKGPAPQASSTISDLQNHSLNAMQALEQIAEEKKLGSGSGSEPRLECGL